jgi:hypothetical protein
LEVNMVSSKQRSLVLTKQRIVGSGSTDITHKFAKDVYGQTMECLLYLLKWKSCKINPSNVHSITSMILYLDFVRATCRCLDVYGFGFGRQGYKAINCETWWLITPISLQAGSIFICLY